MAETKREISTRLRIERAYWNNPRIWQHPYESRINMWRYAMGLDDTADIMRRIEKNSGEI